MSHDVKCIFIIFGILNLFAFFLMGCDKFKARAHAYRISERALFTSALMGGAVGIWAGMYFFRHKCRRWYFIVTMPVLSVIQIVMLVLVLINIDTLPEYFTKAVSFFFFEHLM